MVEDINEFFFFYLFSSDKRWVQRVVAVIVLDRS